MTLLPSSSAKSVDDHLFQFVSKDLFVLDTIAPAKTKKIFGKQKAPWRNDTNVANKKRECRKAERKWRKSNLHIDYDILKASLRIYNSELKRARKSHFSNLINENINNTRALFATIDKLTNHLSQFPSEFV